VAAKRYRLQVDSDLSPKFIGTNIFDLVYTKQLYAYTSKPNTSSNLRRYMHMKWCRYLWTNCLKYIAFLWCTITSKQLPIMVTMHTSIIMIYPNEAHLHSPGKSHPPPSGMIGPYTVVWDKKKWCRCLGTTKASSC